MFVYFDQNGTLKEIITEKTFRVGDSKRDKIYVYWEGEHSPISGWVKYRKPDGTETSEKVFYQVGANDLVGKSLPTKPLRNLKYFSYDHTYEENGETKIGYKFYEITIPDEVLNSSYEDEDIPTKNNMVVARIRFVMDDGTNEGEVDDADTIEALGAIVFAVETSIGILSDSSIDESQYNYLISLMSMKLGLNVLSQKVAQLPEEGVAGTIYYVEKEDNGIIYDAYFWNGTQFVFMGTTSYDLYTKQEGEDFETAIQALLNAEMTDYKALMNSDWAIYQQSINSQIASLSSVIQSAASGSPKDVYPNLTALQNAYPTGTSGIYVVSADGKWYYWNSSSESWTAGGQYLSTADSVPETRKICGLTLEQDISNTDLENAFCDNDFIEGSGSPVKDKLLASMFEYVEPLNIFDFEHKTDNYRMDAQGNLTADSNFCITDYIKVKPGDVIKGGLFYSYPFSLNLNIRFVTAYSKHKELMPNAGSNAENMTSFTVPDGVFYLKLSLVGSYKEISYFPMIYKYNGVSEPTGYGEFFEPYYRLKLKNLKIDKELKSASENLIENKLVGSIFEKVMPKNLLDTTKLTDGKYVVPTGKLNTSADYKTTDYIPVEEGQTISFQRNGALANWFRGCAYDENKNVVYLDAFNDSSSSIVIPAGVKYIRVCSPYFNVNDYKPMIFVGTTAQTYQAYEEPYYIIKEKNLNIEAINEIVRNAKIEIEQLSFAEWENYFDKETAKYGYYVWNGNESANSSYFASDYIEVEPNTAYAIASSSYQMSAKFIEEYDADKNVIAPGYNGSISTIVTKANTKYIRVSFFALDSSYSNKTAAAVVKGTTPAINVPHKKLIPLKYIKSAPVVKAFLPKEICCAVGTTIEIYNDQVMPCADKYHFQWNCQVGKPLNRKFSVTGTSENKGTYSLTLTIYDDNMNIVSSSTSSLRIVDGLATSKKICPIGDSLTNAKYWLTFVNTTLSNGNVKYVGTRGSVENQKHEGRSGWSTTSYLSNTQYTYEQPATPNPFWDTANNKFSWSYYKSTYSIDPDAVQIWLGTNDLLGMPATQFVTNMKAMISAIRASDATIPIEICLTILPAEQNGIGAQTSNDGFSSAAGRWQYQWWNTIIDGVSLLEEELIALNDANLHIIPLVCSHDSKYNFGLVETPVNPRTPNITEPMPVEGVHPQQNGYEQIADILFSCYSAHL